jgi:group I intron endonuclease
MKICSIYKIINKSNDKVYIGQTWLTLSKRWGLHCSNKSCCTKLRNAIEKYGRDNFIIELLDETTSQDFADWLEISYIGLYDSIKNGYNIKEGGSRGKWSEESKAKISKTNMGHTVSEEARRKLSIAHTGKIITDTHRKNMSIAQTGRKHSENSKQKMRGENNVMAKLIREQVNEIIKLYETGNYTSRQLAKKFSVGKSTILRIINGVSWK